jgi:hypothetical protein
MSIMHSVPPRMVAARLDVFLINLVHHCQCSLWWPRVRSVLVTILFTRLSLCNGASYITLVVVGAYINEHVCIPRRYTADGDVISLSLSD